ncbi:MAG: GEVED domain-containing protein, partial [Planctomycetota bacterium]|nr:GEVED domain-containing protein [Planctomycetota bacterium]
MCLTHWLKSRFPAISGTVQALCWPPSRRREARYPKQFVTVAAVEQLEDRILLAIAVEISSVPEYGVDGFITGNVSDVDPATHAVAVYIQIEGAGWWTKPTSSTRTVPIRADGSFIADVATGGIDNRATIFCAAVVPSSVTPPLALGASRIPANLEPVVIDCVERYSRTIQFAGRSWGVKEAPVGVGPGGNRFSNEVTDVFIDDDGLHLSVSYHDGAWWSTEVILLDRLGHGTYSWETSSNLADLDPNVVFGMFTWDPYGDDESGADPHREIDFEDSRWGNASDVTNAQTVVQPFGTPGNLQRYTLPVPGADPALTRFFTWADGQIEFVALQGQHNPLSFPLEDVIEQRVYTHDPGAGHFVPTVGRESIRLNAWLFEGRPPADGQPVEIVVSNFTFQSDASLGVDYGDAPDTSTGSGVGNYKTLATDSGPAHTIVAGLFLGATVDGDDGTLNNTAANADDNNGTPADDEDGVPGPRVLAGTVGTQPTVTLLATNTTDTLATLSGWIDFNGDGVFDNANEHARISVPTGTTDGRFMLTFPSIPSGSVEQTYARFRLSTDPVAENSTGAASDGEVEDYEFTITTPGLHIVNPRDGSTITDTSPHFQWTEVEGATSYAYWISDRTQRVSGLYRNFGYWPVTEFVPRDVLLPGNYRLEVRAQRPAVGPWTVINFTIGETSSPVITDPVGPTAFPTIAWTPVSGAETYDLSVTDTSNNPIRAENGLTRS